MSRRTLAWLTVVACLLAACAAGRGLSAPSGGAGEAPLTGADEPAPGPTTAQSDGSSPAPTDGLPDDEEGEGAAGEGGAALPGLPPAPDPPPPPELSPAETHPEAKARAAEVAQHLTTYEPGTTIDELVADLAVDPDHRARLVTTVRPIHHDGAWSRGEVVYPQLGGFDDHGRGSVMVVVRQTVGHPDGTITEETRTFDVRIVDDAGEWVVADVASVGGVPAAERPELSDAAVAVLEDDRIELPDSARWDIQRGRIADELLEVMLRLADEVGDYGVVVLDAGHPTHVFTSGRVSDHTRGWAVDIHRIGDTLVIDDRHEGSRTRQVVEWLYEDPAGPVIGSPWALDPYGGRSFTDQVHQDHLHVAVRLGEADPITPGGPA